MTVTPTDWLAEPPAPVQVNVNELVAAVSGPVLAEPAVARLPLQAPDAVHDVAFNELQFKFEVPPLATLSGLALKVTVGWGAVTFTLTAADALAEPPAPTQVNVNELVAAVSGPVLAEPAVARLPLQAPDAVHDVAFSEFQVKFEVPPLATLSGLALNDTVGWGVAGALTVTTAEALAGPPAPMQVSVKVLLAAVNAPVLAEPVVARPPDHAPLAVHEVAFVADQVRVDAAPFAMALGLALSVTVGATTTWLFTLTTTVDDPRLPAASRATASSV
jgi:hypothetical protein